MKLLVLGGTRFVGLHTVEAALRRGHDVTLFHRGRSGAGLFPAARHLIGDRTVDLSPLRGQTWDALIDMCGYLPAVVNDSATLLSDSVGFAVFVSSISAYANLNKPGGDESEPLASLSEEQQAVVASIDRSSPGAHPRFGELYGALKAGCEDVIIRNFGDRCALVRPGLIVGPGDYTHRFTYWVNRVAEGGEVLAPGRPERVVQFIDARDLGDWMVRLAEERVSGPFSATGPYPNLTMGEMLETCRTALHSDARFRWADERFLLKENVVPWQDLPLWLPESSEDSPLGMLQVSVQRAIAAGLTFRPLAQTVTDIHAWASTHQPSQQVGLSRERERELLSGI